MEIISGEKIQNICDYYLGNMSDFRFNPYILSQTNKHLFFDNLINKDIIDNPKVLFCYAYSLDTLAKIIDKFTNNFVLVSHNSDHCINDNDENIKHILNNNKLIKWYSQNILVEHDKLHFLPIGIANNMWEHGKDFVRFYENNKNNIHKTEYIYFNFNIKTNSKARQPCYDTFKNSLTFLNNINSYDNLKRLSRYKYCICPTGNGVDTHRLWECFYLKCVPIVLFDTFINILQKNTNLPLIILEKWDDLDINDMPPYEKFDFESSKHFMDLNYYKFLIENIIL